MSDADDHRSRADQLVQAIAAQEQLRGVVDDELIEATISALRDRLAALRQTRRRQATILFADIVGFTPMSEAMDAETVTELVDRLWHRLDAVVVEHGGQVDKHIGDALMAVWGAVATAEDDPQRAVLAALELQRVVRTLAHSTGHQVSMRVGLNTGPVVFAAVGTTEEYTAMGDVVNVASRLEHAAPHGGVCIGHDTYRHVRGLFDVRPLDGLALKGKAAPQRAYLVLRAKPRAFRLRASAVEGLETTTVGRDAELARMQASFTRSVSERRSELVVLTGEPGAGKSRLLFEFANWLDLHDAEVFYFEGVASPQRRQQPLGLLMDVVAARAGVAEGDATPAVAQKLLTALGGVLTPEEISVLARWLGFDVAGSDLAVGGVMPGEGMSTTAAAHLASFLRVLADESPVVWLLEDIHWADDESLDAVLQLVDRLADRPFTVVAAARPDLAARRPDVVSADGVQRIELHGLDADATSRLIDEILQRLPEVPDRLHRLIVERSEGNPFYVEELIKMLIDDEVIVAAPERELWSVDEARLRPDRVPSTLTGVLQARLDGLPGTDQRTLQLGSVMGRVFWDAAVASLGDGAAPRLDAALGRELVFGQIPAAFAGTEEFRFVHALLRDVAYETVLLADRPLLHARAAVWLDQRVGTRRGEYLTVLANHHRLAGDLVAAAECLAQAGAAAMRVGQLRAAAASIEEARALWDAAGIAPSAAAELCGAEASLKLGSLDAADRAAARARWRADAEGDQSVVVDAIRCAATVASKRGLHDESLLRLREAMPVAEEVGGAPLVRLLARMVFTLVDRDELEEARHLARRGLTIAEGDGDTAAHAQALDAMAAAAAEQGDLDAAQRHLESALDVVRPTGDLVKVIDLEQNLGVVHHLRGDQVDDADEYRRARAHYEAAGDLAVRLDRRVTNSNTLSNRAQVAVRLGEPVVALDLARQSLAIAVAVGAVTDALFALQCRAEALVLLGRIGEAMALFAMIRAHPATVAAGHHEIDEVLRRLDVDVGRLEVAAPVTFESATAACLDDPGGLPPN